MNNPTPPLRVGVDAPAAPQVSPVAASLVVVIAEGLGHLVGADGHEWYDFWSGLGADVGQVALFGAAIGIYRKHNCHVHRCWRIAKQQVEGTTWMVCHRHHPEGKPTEATMTALAAKRRAAQAGSSITLTE